MKGLMFIENKRLKLYDTSIEIVINHKEKEKIRKIAYKNNITMSEYIRHLINFAIEINNINNSDNKISVSNKNIDKIIGLLGGNFNG